MKSTLPHPSSFALFLLSLLTLCISVATPAGATTGVFNVKNFGATGDGETLDTRAIQSAVDACAKSGGGKILIPSGKYLVGCIELRSNTNLHLSAGAILLGSTSQADYTTKTPAYISRTNDLYVNKSIIYAENADNVSLTGQGVINGQGRSRSFARVRPQTSRPYLARFIQCRNLTVRDVSMLEAANWTCHILGCRDVLIDGLKIKNTARANRDGLDIDSSSYVTVTNCRITSQDDALVIKSTGADKAQNITVTNCLISSHAAGIKMGTESTGAYENVTISNCVLRDVNLGGISLMTVDGGVMNNITINNIVMQRVKIPFMIRLGNRARPHTAGVPTPGIGEVRDIMISNIIATDATLPSHLTGLHRKSIKNISLSHISIHYKNGYNRKPMAYNKVPFKESAYPGARLYGNNLPASVFYCRNVDGLSIDHVKAFFGAKETRVPFVFDGVQGLSFSHCEVIENNAAPALLYLRNTSRALVNACSNAGASTHLAHHEKGSCAAISVSPDLLAPQQLPLLSVVDLPDKTYEEVKGATHVFNNATTTYKGLYCHALTNASAKFTLKATKGRHVKLMILCANKGIPQHLKITMNGVIQRIKVHGVNWHWAVANFQNPVTGDLQQKITIQSENPTSSVIIAKVVLIPVFVTD